MSEDNPLRPHVGDMAWFPGDEQPVAVVEIDRHQARIDDGNDTRWVLLSSLEAVA